MKATDIVKFNPAGVLINDATFKGSLLRVTKKGKLVVAVTVDPADVVECTPRTYKKGYKSAANKSVNTELKS